MSSGFRIVLDEAAQSYEAIKIGGKGSGPHGSGLAYELLSAIAQPGRSFNPPEGVSRARIAKAIGKLRDLGLINEMLDLNGFYVRVPSKYRLRTVQIEALLRCNLSCPYCYCSAGHARQERLEEEQMQRVLEDAARLGVSIIDFTGGEILLLPYWKELIEGARALGLRVHMHSNGTTLTERNVDFLKQQGVEHVQVTFDSHMAADHDASRGLRGAFEKSLAGMGLLKRAGITTRAALMVHKSNLAYFPQTYNFFSKIADSFGYDWIAPFGSERTSMSHGVTPKEFFEATAQLRDEGYVVANQRPCGREVGRAPNDYEPDCGIGYSYLFITATGEMAICPTLTSRESLEQFNGPNLRDISLYDAWMGHPYFDKHRHVNCRNVQTCPAGQSCRGGCRATAYVVSGGDLSSPNVIECNQRKNATSHYVDFLARYAAGNFASVMDGTELKGLS